MWTEAPDECCCNSRRVDVLVLDGFAMAPLKDAERRDFLEICDDRCCPNEPVLGEGMAPDQPGQV